MGQLTRRAAISVGLVVALPIQGLAGDRTNSPVVGFCCPGDDHGLELQSVGLGQSNPPGPDLSLDPAWRVYGFKRDGIEYFQVNDLTGRVQLIIGSAGGKYWTLPAGEASANVILPPQHDSKPWAGERSRVYLSPAFSLVRHRVGDRAIWSVEMPTAPR